jgi:hypothetical protein
MKECNGKKRIILFRFYKECLVVAVLLILYVAVYLMLTKGILEAYLLALFVIIWNIYLINKKGFSSLSKDAIASMASNFLTTKSRLQDIHGLIKEIPISKKELDRLIFHDEKCEKLYDDYLSEGDESHLKELEQLLKQRISDGPSET